MIGADLSRAILVLILIFVSGADTPRYWMALVVFLVGIGDAFGGPASSAIINTVLPDSVLQQGNVFRGAISRIGGIIGPAIGVGLVALIGARLTFLLTAGAFLISVALLTGVKESAHIPKEIHEPFIDELKDGIRTVVATPWIGAMILMATFQLLVVVASETVLLPVITKREFSTNTTMAAASAAFAIGATVCSFYSLRIKTNHPGRVSLILWSLFAAIPLSLAFPDQKWIVIAYLFGGISVSFTVVNDSTITFTAPAHSLGPVSISVTTPYGTTTKDNAFNSVVVPAPAITGVSPATGGIGGGTSVTISINNGCNTTYAC